MFLFWVLSRSLFLTWVTTAVFSIKFVNFKYISYVKLNKYFSLSKGRIIYMYIYFSYVYIYIRKYIFIYIFFIIYFRYSRIYIFLMWNWINISLSLSKGRISWRRSLTNWKWSSSPRKKWTATFGRANTLLSSRWCRRRPQRRKKKPKLQN